MARTHGLHWLDDSPLIWVDDEAELSAEELDELPAHLFGKLTEWPGHLDELPESKQALKNRTPVLERVQFNVPEAVHWCLRLPKPGQSQNEQILGFNGRQKTALPLSKNPANDWLAQFGVWQFSGMASGTAQFGSTLEDVRHLLFEDLELPEGSGRWHALFEADGDWCFADSSTGQVHWVGFEWLGESATSSLSWTDTTSAIFKSMIAGEIPRPDLLGFEL